MAALVVDVGALLDERRQLQNGADAGALAVAHSCALGACDVALAEGLADANSRDGDSMVDSVTTDPATKQVRVTISTQGGGGNVLPYAFGQVVTGQKGKTVRATATASWTRRPAPRPSPSPSPSPSARRSSSWSGPTSVIHSPSPAGPAWPRTPPGNFGWLDARLPGHLHRRRGRSPATRASRARRPAWTRVSTPT